MVPALALALVALAPAASAAERAVDLEPRESGCDRAGFCWSATNITVDVGDRVVLRFANPASNAAPHSLRVQGDVNQGTPVRLPGESRPTDVVAFNATAAGVVPFVCEVHSGMRGGVYVKPLPDPANEPPRPFIPAPALVAALAALALAARPWRRR